MLVYDDYLSAIRFYVIDTTITAIGMAMFLVPFTLIVSMI